MTEKRSGWLKFNYIIDTDSGEEKSGVVRHWFILQDTMIIHSGKRSQLDLIGEYINLENFHPKVQTNPEDPEGFILTADEPRKIKVFLSGDHFEDWMAALTHTLNGIARRKSGMAASSSDEDEMIPPVSPGRATVADNTDASIEMDSGNDIPAASPRAGLVRTSSSNFHAGPESPGRERSDSIDKDQSRNRSMTKSNKIAKLIAAAGGASPAPELEPANANVQKESKGPKLVYHLTARISEARGLVKDGSSVDAYCSVNVDAARKRTRSVAKTTNPLWTDEFNFEVLDPTTSKLTLGIWDESSKSSSSDRLLAKAEIGLDSLSSQSAESWYPLSYARKEAYVSGGLHVRIDRSNEKLGVLIVTVVEAKNLVNYGKGSQEYFVRLEYGKQTFKTKTFAVKDSAKAKPGSLIQQDPEWNEVWEVKPEPDADSFHFSVINKSASNSCVGVCSLTKMLHFFDEKFIDRWVVLEADPEEVNKEIKRQRESSGEKCGDVRVTLRLNKVVVYPLEYYEPLIKFLFEEEGKRCVEVLEKTTVGPDLRNSISQTLVRIYEARNKAPSVLRTLISHEVDEAPDVETLFRANSIGSKAVDGYMKLVGYRYLNSVASAVVDELYEETKKTCEVDSMKLEKGEDPKKNFKFLMKILNKLLQRLNETVDECPTPLRGIFQHIQHEVDRKFPGDSNVKYTGVSGFLFLRFICAAILGPKLFDLKSDHPGPVPLKNLTVVAKTLQRIANMAPTTPGLEGPLGELEKFVETEKEKMKVFLNKIATPNESLYVFDPASVDLQHELSNLQESLEKQLESIVAVWYELQSTNRRVSTSAAQLLLVLEQMNDGRHEAIFTKASREKRAEDPEATLELMPKYMEYLKKREEKARAIQEAQAEYNRQQALLAEKGATDEPPKKDDIKIEKLPDDADIRGLGNKKSSFAKLSIKKSNSTEGSPRSEKKKDKDKKDKKEKRSLASTIVEDDLLKSDKKDPLRSLKRHNSRSESAGPSPASRHRSQTERAAKVAFSDPSSPAESPMRSSKKAHKEDDPSPRAATVGGTTDENSPRKKDKKDRKEKRKSKKIDFSEEEPVESEEDGAAGEEADDHADDEHEGESVDDHSEEDSAAASSSD